MGPPVKLLVGVLLASLVSIVVAAEAPAPSIVTAQPKVSSAPAFHCLVAAFSHIHFYRLWGAYPFFTKNLLLAEAVSVLSGSRQGLSDPSHKYRTPSGSFGVHNA